MEAKQKQGMAALEEYIQEYYISNFDDIDTVKNKVEQIKTKKNEWFYKISEGYIVDSEGHALYLFVKDNLPNEIKEQLVGGNAGEGTYRDYYNLNDVYGVTSELKVYYCSNGMESLAGIDKSELDMDSVSREIIDNQSNLGKLLVGENSDEKITLSKIREVDKLTINENSGITDLQEFYKLTSLKELTLENLKGDINFSLSGLENAVSLNYLYFKNCDLSNYGTMKDLTDLKYLYLEQSCDNEVSKIFTAMAGIDYNKLEYLGIYGALPANISRGQSDFSGGSDSIRGEVTNISYLSQLTDNTKENIKYLYLNNNKIENIDYISDYPSVILLNLSYNSISSLKNGLSKMSSLKYFAAKSNSITSLLGLENTEVLVSCGMAENRLEDIESLPISVRQLDLRNNLKLKNAGKIAGCQSISFLYLSGCSNLNSSDVRLFADLYNSITYSTRKDIDQKFLKDLETDELKNWASNNLTDDKIEELENNTYIKKLNLSKNSLLGNTTFSSMDISTQEKIKSKLGQSENR